MRFIDLSRHFLLCAVLFIDLKSAFDTIDPDILIKKLQHYGFRGKISNLLKSYLTGRKQFIQYGDIESELLEVLCGVPQGSVLGPLLFIVYINDLEKCSKFEAVLFADDAALNIHDKQLNRLQKEMNSEAKHLHEWFIANKLTLNLKKTKFMLFNRQKLKANAMRKFRLNINKMNIEQVDEIKYLGVYLDNKLNWHKHIENLCTKLSRTAGVMYKFRKRFPLKVKLLIYNSLVASCLNYGIMCWGTSQSTLINKLQSMQNKVIRYMTNIPQSIRVEQKFKQLNILNIRELFFIETSKFMHKLSKKTLPGVFDECFMNIDHSHDTRSRVRTQYILPNPNTNLGKKSFKFFGIKIWSKLDQTTKSITNNKSFSTHLKKYIIDNAIDVSY